MRGIVFDTKEACEAALEQIRLTLRQSALDTGMEIVLRDGEEMIVPLRNGVPDPDAVGTFRWDVPHKAEGAEQWYCASPLDRYPDAFAAMAENEIDIPQEWLTSEEESF